MDPLLTYYEKFPGKPIKIGSSKPTVTRGMLTYRSEGRDEGKFDTKKMHVPSGSKESGVTIGRGYDLGWETKPREDRLKMIENDLKKAGLNDEQIKIAKECYGLKGSDARAKLAELTKSKKNLLTITEDSQIKLFNVAYNERYEQMKSLIAEKIQDGKGAYDYLTKKGSNGTEIPEPLLELLTDMRYQAGNSQQPLQMIKKSKSMDELLEKLYDFENSQRSSFNERTLNRKFLISQMRQNLRIEDNFGQTTMGLQFTSKADPKTPAKKYTMNDGYEFQKDFLTNIGKQAGGSNYIEQLKNYIQNDGCMLVCLGNMMNKNPQALLEQAVEQGFVTRDYSQPQKQQKLIVDTLQLCRANGYDFKTYDPQKCMNEFIASDFSKKNFLVATQSPRGGSELHWNTVEFYDPATQKLKVFDPSDGISKYIDPADIKWINVFSDKEEASNNKNKLSDQLLNIPLHGAGLSMKSQVSEICHAKNSTGESVLLITLKDGQVVALNNVNGGFESAIGCTPTEKPLKLPDNTTLEKVKKNGGRSTKEYRKNIINSSKSYAAGALIGQTIGTIIRLYWEKGNDLTFNDVRKSLDYIGLLQFAASFFALCGPFLSHLNLYLRLKTFHDIVIRNEELREQGKKTNYSQDLFKWGISTLVAMLVNFVGINVAVGLMGKCTLFFSPGGLFLLAIGIGVGSNFLSLIFDKFLDWLLSRECVNKLMNEFFEWAEPYLSNKMKKFVDFVEKLLAKLKELFCLFDERISIIYSEFYPDDDSGKPSKPLSFLYKCPEGKTFVPSCPQTFGSAVSSKANNSSNISKFLYKSSQDFNVNSKKISENKITTKFFSGEGRRIGSPDEHKK